MMEKVNEKTFEEWHVELTKLAKEHGLGWMIPPVENYPEDGYNDGLTPAEELSEQLLAESN